MTYDLLWTLAHQLDCTLDQWRPESRLETFIDLEIFTDIEVLRDTHRLRDIHRLTMHYDAAFT